MDPDSTTERDSTLSVAVERSDGSAVVTIGGDLEYGTAGPLRSVLAELAQEGADPIVVDLSAVDFIDSTGVSLLVQAKQRIDSQGTRLVLRSPAHRVMRVLDVAGLTDVFEIV